MYKRATANDAADIVASIEGDPLSRLLCRTDVPFFQRQQKIVLENSGVVDPERIEDYIAANGYSAMMRVITEMTPAEVIEQVAKSGLRGRGGAGYPTGLKWSTVAKATPKKLKYAICNADEGDPGAFMDRSVLESDPHRLLEGMLIAAYAVGASEGFHLCARRVPTRRQAAAHGHTSGGTSGLAGPQHLRNPFQFRN